MYSRAFSHRLGPAYGTPPLGLSTKSQPQNLQKAQQKALHLRSGAAWWEGAFPKKKPFGGSGKAAFQRLIERLPQWMQAHLQEDTIHRTIKYTTWGLPVVVFPPLTYLATKDKNEARDNAVRETARYAPGPVIQLGIDALLLEVILPRYCPRAFQHKNQAQLVAFGTAFFFYTLWSTFGIQRVVEAERKLAQTHQKQLKPNALAHHPIGQPPAFQRLA